MGKDEQLEEQIRQFYENVPEVQDAFPMKDYLLKHENNQMAWYLLGKQYAARGEMGKANYCFAHAGPVYEAFESRSTPVLDGGAEGMRAERRRKFGGRGMAAAAVLFLLALGLLLRGGQASAPGTAERSASAAPVVSAAQGEAAARPGISSPAATTPDGTAPDGTGSGKTSPNGMGLGGTIPNGEAPGGTANGANGAALDGTANGGKNASGAAPGGTTTGGTFPSGASPGGTTTGGTFPSGAASGGTAQPSGGGGARLAYVAGAADPEADGPAALGRLLTTTEAPSSSLLVQAPALDGKWTDWLRSGKPLASVAAAASGQAAAVSWFAGGWCPCQGGQDPSTARQTVAAWKPLQEAKLALTSAIDRYHARTGKWPDSPGQLAGAYPNNTMAGWSQEMTAWFEEIRKELAKADGHVPTTVPWPNEAGPEAASGQPAGALAPLAGQPLEVIVDKKNHRLAVVSGGVLLRNYAVGLGGDRTPEGKFVITEKVRNPNGRDDGEFGSRGMTLSDTLYAIHGTNDPDSIGKDESNGCVRMDKEDLEELYDLVPLGTPVTIVKEGLPRELRAPAERFRLEAQQDETNPRKQYHWLS